MTLMIKMHKCHDCGCKVPPLALHWVASPAVRSLGDEFAASCPDCAEWFAENIDDANVIRDHASNKDLPFARGGWIYKELMRNTPH